ncbi:MAG: IS110 family transposase [Acidobacteriota bacterium]|jgi:transposase
MALYCGIDLHSRDCWLAILDDRLKIVHEAKVGNDLQDLLLVLEPYREDLEGVAVESTYNWYWLVDGLSDAGYQMHLVNTWAVKQWEGLKYTDDRHDARWLAHLLALGILPEGFICPKRERAVRDLLRRRAFLVRKRTSFLLAMRGAFECRTGKRTTSNEIRQWSSEEIESHLDDATEALGITCLLEPMKAVNDQIGILEKEALARAKLRDEFAPLLTVWGIGKVLGLTIMYEVGEITRFEKVGNFASYCRLVKSTRLSAGKRKGSGNSRNGNPYLSWAFSEAAHFAVRYHPEAKKCFQRKKSKTNGIIAIRAVAHKLARAAYYVMKDQVPFNPEKTFV